MTVSSETAQPEHRLGAAPRVPAQRSASPVPAAPTAPPAPRPQGSSSLSALPWIALAIDVVAIVATAVAATRGRGLLVQWGVPITAPGDVVLHLLLVAPVMTLAGVAAVAALGGYQTAIFGAGTDEYRRVLNGWLVTVAAIGLGCYLLRFPLPRGFFVLLALVGPVLLVGGRWGMRRVVTRLRAQGALQHRVLIVGTERHIDDVAEVLARESWLGYHVVGALLPDVRRVATATGVPVLGQTTHVAEVARQAGADIVFLAGGAFDSATQVRHLAWELEHEAIQVVIAPSVTDVASERISVRPVGGLPLIHMEKPRSEGAVRRAKRAFDIIGSFTLLLAFSPVFAFAAYKIHRFDGGPIFFKQTRIGRDGTPFQCWKFRTMVTNAEELLARLHAEQGYAGGLFKMENDPRITTPGTWLRRFSLDELPQLINVLRGTMSLVGPRPPLRHEVAQYDDTMTRRLRVRPGMTGLWQVSGRSDLSWSEAIRLDLYYVDNWSMVQDLTILARTLGAVIGSRGAY